MAAGLLSGLTNFIFGSTDNSQYLQEVARQQMAAEEARQREAQAYAQQARYAQYLQSVMNGSAPSMAAMQLYQGLGAIQAQQQGMAAGVGGPGAALARYGAAVNSANAGGAMNQAQALARVAELNSARTQFGQNAGLMAQESGNLYGTAGKLGTDYSQIASGTAIGQTNQANSNQQAGALIKGIGDAAAMYFSRPTQDQNQQQSTNTTTNNYY